MKTILITGAAGGIGTYLRREFKGKYALRLSDREPINTLGEGESFVQADLSDLDAICAAAEGVDGILHFGGCAGEAPWETILGANIVGMRTDMAKRSSICELETFRPNPWTSGASRSGSARAISPNFAASRSIIRTSGSAGTSTIARVSSGN